MTTLRQQIMMKRTLRNLRTWAPPISIGVIIGVLAYFAVEKLDARPAPAPANQVSASQPSQIAHVQHSSRSAATLPVQREPVVSTSYQSTAFRNCAEARAAGAAPVYAGEPGYGEHLDGDHDGIGCEPYHPR
ncbi:MAG: excalibur calcium-binding domain-containing protein [Hyphomonadaceae bacterium]|nr:excalibur calcium-binding domain-containing protein [Hyphomonadaceae bacterium]